MPSDCACSACARRYGTAGEIVIDEFEKLKKELESIKKTNSELKKRLQVASMTKDQVIDFVLKNEGLI